MSTASLDSATAVPVHTAPGPLVRFAWLVLGWNVLIILWGAVVRATGSGAGCGNHWPLCNGVVVPVNPRVDTLIEFTHRVTTGLALPLILLLVFWIFRQTARGMLARPLVVLALLLTLNEALLGALLVKLGYVAGNQSIGRAAFLSLHLTNTLLLVAALTVTAASLERGTARSRVHPSRGSVAPVLSAVVATIVVGVTGSLAALGDTLFPSTTLAGALAQDLSSTSYYLVRLRWIHPVASVLASLFSVWLVRRCWNTPDRPLARRLIWLLAAQFALGLADVLLLAPVPLQIAHLLLANLFWISLVLLAFRHLFPSGSSPVNEELRLHTR